MLQYARFRGAGGWAASAHAAGQAFLHRVAPLPPALRRVSLEVAERAYDPEVLGQAIGSLLRTPPPLDLRHMAIPRVSLADRVALLRDLLARRSGRFSFDEAVDGADRVTVAVTLFALLELYKRGEAGWEQDEPFGPITVQRSPCMGSLARRSRRCSSSRPSRSPLDELADALQAGEEAVRDGAGRARARRSTAAASSCARSPAAGRSPRTRTPRRPRAACSPARAPRP